MIPVAGPPYQGLSLNSSLIWWFRDQERGQYDLMDARYVITPAPWRSPTSTASIQQSGKYALYRVPTSGVAEYVEIAGAGQRADAALSCSMRNVEWFRGDQPARLEYIHWDYMSRPGLSDISAGLSGRADPVRDRRARIDHRGRRVPGRGRRSS